MGISTNASSKIPLKFESCRAHQRRATRRHGTLTESTTADAEDRVSRLDAILDEIGGIDGWTEAVPSGRSVS